MASNVTLFQEFQTSFKNQLLTLLVMGGLAVALLAIYTTFPEQQGNATIFVLMFIFYVLATILNTLPVFKNFVGQLGVGNNPLMPFIIGVVAGFFLLLINSFQALVTPPFSIVISVDKLLGAFYMVVIAPLFETAFFRGIIMPTINQYIASLLRVKMGFISGVIAVFLQAIVFTIFHLYVLQGNESQITFIFVFGLVAGFLVYFTKSIASEYGLHGLNNLLAALKILGV